MVMQFAVPGLLESPPFRQLRSKWARIVLERMEEGTVRSDVQPQRDPEADRYHGSGSEANVIGD